MRQMFFNQVTQWKSVYFTKRKIAWKGQNRNKSKPNDSTRFLYFRKELNFKLITRYI